ncbi:hypothetical protein BST61_g9957 [Cercospora zeina]
MQFAFVLTSLLSIASFAIAECSNEFCLCQYCVSIQTCANKYCPGGVTTGPQPNCAAVVPPSDCSIY